MIPERKSTTLKQLDETGAIEAIIATIGVVDLDGDIVERGALVGKSAPIVPAHQQHTVPLGKVTIEERGDEVVAAGTLNLAIQAARDWHAALKYDLEHPPALQEWSWGYLPIGARREIREKRDVRILTSETDLIEVSPVLRGASVGTGTVSVKAATAPHGGPTSEAPWDGPANERRLPSPVPVAVARQAYAWLDEDAVEDGMIPKSACRFIHHFIDGEGELGAASTRAAVTGIAVLNGARGGTTIPDSERQGVWRHLSRHLKDAEVEAPELASRDAEPGCKLSDQLLFAAWDVDAVVERMRRDAQRLSLRKDERGRQRSKLSDETLVKGVELAAAFGGMKHAAESLAAFVAHVEQGRDGDAVERAMGAYQVHLARYGRP